MPHACCGWCCCCWYGCWRYPTQSGRQIRESNLAIPRRCCPRDLRYRRVALLDQIISHASVPVKHIFYHTAFAGRIELGVIVCAVDGVHSSGLASDNLCIHVMFKTSSPFLMSRSSFALFALKITLLLVLEDASHLAKPIPDWIPLTAIHCYHILARFKMLEKFRRVSMLHWREERRRPGLQQTAFDTHATHLLSALHDTSATTTCSSACTL